MPIKHPRRSNAVNSGRSGKSNLRFSALAPRAPLPPAPTFVQFHLPDSARADSRSPSQSTFQSFESLTTSALSETHRTMRGVGRRTLAGLQAAIGPPMAELSGHGRPMIHGCVSQSGLAGHEPVTHEREMNVVITGPDGVRKYSQQPCVVANVNWCGCAHPDGRKRNGCVPLVCRLDAAGDPITTVDSNGFFTDIVINGARVKPTQCVAKGERLVVHRVQTSAYRFSVESDGHPDNETMHRGIHAWCSVTRRLLSTMYNNTDECIHCINQECGRRKNTVYEVCGYCNDAHNDTTPDQSEDEEDESDRAAEIGREARQARESIDRFAAQGREGDGARASASAQAHVSAQAYASALAQALASVQSTDRAMARSIARKHAREHDREALRRAYAATPKEQAEDHARAREREQAHQAKRKARVYFDSDDDSATEIDGDAPIAKFLRVSEEHRSCAQY